VKVLIQREQGIGLEFAKDLAQFLFDAIDRVEEIAAVDVQAAAAQTPIGAEQEMKAEELVFFRCQRPAGDEREIGDVFFILAAPDPAAAASGAIQRHLAQVLLFGCAMAKPGVARPEDRAQHAIACVRFASFQTAYARPKAVRAVGNGQRQGFRSGPLH